MEGDTRHPELVELKRAITGLPQIRLGDTETHVELSYGTRVVASMAKPVRMDGGFDAIFGEGSAEVTILKGDKRDGWEEPIQPDVVYRQHPYIEQNTSSL